MFDSIPILEVSLPNESCDGRRCGLMGAALTVLVEGYIASKVEREVLEEIRLRR